MIHMTAKKGKRIESPRICSYCGTMLNSQEAWERKEKNEILCTDSSASHGICPDCLLVNFPQEYLAIQEEKRIRIRNIFKKGYQDLYGHLVK